MYKIIYSTYFFIKRHQKKLIEKNKKQNKLCDKIIGYIEAYYNLFWVKHIKSKPFKVKGINKKHRTEKIIVSLTSFPKRIDGVWITIVTLLNQTVQPDEIILWLAEEQFDGLESLPENLLNLQQYGLQIRFCDDLRSHKKYYYVMAEHPDDLVILADDDTFFPCDMIEQLYKLHIKNPKDIIGTTVVKVDDYFSLPAQWGKLKSGERALHSMHIQPYTGQGTLYPPHSLDEEYLFNKDLIMKLCPYADDLWLFYMSLRKKTPVSVVYKERAMPIGIYGTGENSLWQINGKEQKNDIQWQDILDYFSQKENDLRI